MIAGKYDEAIASFQTAEDVWNSYHNAYEIAKLLRENRSQMNDLTKKKEIFKTIVDKYSSGAPPDLLAKVKAAAETL